MPAGARIPEPPSERVSITDLRSQEAVAARLAAPEVYYLPPPPTGLGAVADLLLLPVHAAAVLLGTAATEVGHAVGWDDLAQAGQHIVRADLEASHIVGEHPLAAFEVAGGAVLVATGIATGVGLGLIGNGAREFAADVMTGARGGEPEAQTTDSAMRPVLGAPVPGAPVAGGIADKPQHRTLFAALAAWFHGLFRGGAR